MTPTRPNPGDGGSKTMEVLADELCAVVVRRYRLDEPTARRLVGEALEQERSIAAMASSGMSSEAIRRTRRFKNAASAVRRHVYYTLRRYDRGDAGPDRLAEALRLGATPAGEEREALLRSLAAKHVSTQERLPVLDELHRQLFDQIGRPRTVLDVGCGLYPLLFPFDAEGSSVERYVALDRDPDAIAVLRAYSQARSDQRLIPLRAEIGTDWKPLLALAGVDRFDAALLLKVVPLLERLERARLEAVREVPAALIVLTGSVMSMTKRQRIERRELAVLRRFVTSAGWTVKGRIATADEVGLIASADG